MKKRGIGRGVQPELRGKEKKDVEVSSLRLSMPGMHC